MGFMALFVKLWWIFCCFFWWKFCVTVSNRIWLRWVWVPQPASKSLDICLPGCRACHHVIIRLWWTWDFPGENFDPSWKLSEIGSVEVSWMSLNLIKPLAGLRKLWVLWSLLWQRGHDMLQKGLKFLSEGMKRGMIRLEEQLEGFGLSIPFGCLGVFSMRIWRNYDSRWLDKWYTWSLDGIWNDQGEDDNGDSDTGDDQDEDKDGQRCGPWLSWPLFLG